MAKAKTIMKYKVQSILRGETPNEADFVNVLSRFPDIYDDETKGTAHLERGKATPLEFRILSDMRTTAARHAYTRNAEKRVAELPRPTRKKEKGRVAVEASLPHGEMDERVVQSIAELDRLERVADGRTPGQDDEYEMDVDEDEDPPSSVPDEDNDPGNSNDGGDIQNDGSGSGQDAGIVEDNDNNEPEDGVQYPNGDEIDMIAEEEVRDGEDDGR